MQRTLSTTAGVLTVSDEHPGGNVTDASASGSVLRLTPDLRDSTDRPLYWNVEIGSDAEGPITVRFPEHEVVGPWGPAVSHGDDGEWGRDDHADRDWNGDAADWEWLGADARQGPTAFEYRFERGERVRFALSLPYQRAHLAALCDRHPGAIERAPLATTRSGREVPLLTMGDADADSHVLFAARHHACESPASYVLEGVLSAFAESHPDFLATNRVHAVPLVDVDGVARGDQGKHRAPHDHNRDYGLANELLDPDPLYRSTAAIRSYVEDLDGDLALALDCHCPWIRGRPHDRPHFYADPGDPPSRLAALARRLAEITADRTAEDRLRFLDAPGIGFAATGDTGALPAFEDYCRAAGTSLAATLEVPYFGRPDARATPSSYQKFGADIAAAIATIATDARL